MFSFVFYFVCFCYFEIPTNCFNKVKLLFENAQDNHIQSFRDLLITRIIVLQITIANKMHIFPQISWYFVDFVY